jgi:hypothetical protein
MEFDPFDLSVKDLSTQNMITRCNSSGPLYTMRLPSRSAPSPCAAPITALVASASTWHCRLEHPGVDALSKLSSDSSVISSRHTHDFCHACQLSRHTRMPFVSYMSHAVNNFDLIHSHLWTSSVVSDSGYKYYLLILDDCSHFVWTFPLRVKSDTFSTLLIFSPLSPDSLAAPLKPSSVTTVVSSTTPPPTRFSPPVGSSCGCLIPTPLCKTVKLSALFAPSIT